MLRKDIVKTGGAPAATADPAEIARFNALADEWWNETGAFKHAHSFNAARVTHLTTRIAALTGRDPDSEQPLHGLDIADIGCGAGIATEALAARGARMLGLDAASRNIAIAQKHAQQSAADVTYRHGLADELIAEAATFDVVLSLEVVEHVADLEIFLAQLAQLVRPGGLLVIGTLNRTLRSYLKAIVGAEYILRWLPRGTHAWWKFVKPSELKAILAAHGLDVEEIAGVVMNPLTFRWRIAADTSVTYLQFHRRAV